MKKKLLIKQSYLLLTWLLYVTNSTQSTQGPAKSKQFRPVIAIQPTKKTKYTFTKAPMAHKTFSQEQFIFKFYRFRVKFTTVGSASMTVNESIFLLLRLRSTLPTIETNLLFLKKFHLGVLASDPNFFLKTITSTKN